MIDIAKIRALIRARRIELGMTQSQLATAISETESRLSINYYENRSKSLKILTLSKIADALDVDIKYFFPDEEIKPMSDYTWYNNIK